MKAKLFTLALAAITIGLLGSCEKDNGLRDYASCIRLVADMK